MWIPHGDSESDELEYMPVRFPKEKGLTLDDFHPKIQGTTPPFLQHHHGAPNSRWIAVANEIIDLRLRFTRHNPQNKNPRCSNLDRSAVLAVYNEALAKVEHASELDSIKINIEVKQKVATILDVRTAKPDDCVFYKAGAFLSPLEPQYAQPRLNYYDRGTGDGDDSYYWTGYTRLNEWRKEDWPHKYPKMAIERERRDRKMKCRSGRAMLRDTPMEGLKRALEDDSFAWGDEVDAIPKRAQR